MLTRIKHLIMGVVIGLSFTIFVVGTVYALTINLTTQDLSDWTSLQQISPSDPSGDTFASADLTNLWFTNDTTNTYWRFDTVTRTGSSGGASPGYTNTLAGAPSNFRVDICMDTNGLPDGDASECLGNINSDYIIRVSSDPSLTSPGANPLVDLLVCNPTCAISATSAITVAYFDANITTTEVLLPFSEIGITGPCTLAENCPITFTVLVTATVPFGPPPGTLDITDTSQIYIAGIGAPTAITLNDFTAVPTNTNIWLAALGVFTIGLVSGGVWLRRQRTG